MKGEQKTREQLINELAELRQRIAELETAEAERKRAEEAIRQRTAQFEALRELELELIAELDLDALLYSIASRAVELLGGTAAGLYLYRPDREVLDRIVSIGLDPVPNEIVLQRGEGLSGQVWEMDEPLIVDNYQHWEGRAAVWEDYPLAAVVGVPIRWSEEFLGVLNVVADTPCTFSLADAELLSLFANQAAIAIRNARLYEEASSRADRLTVVNHIARAVGATLDLDDLMETVYQEVDSIFQADAFFIALYDQGASELDFRLRVDEGIREAPERRPLGTGLTSLVVNEKKSLLIRDFEKEKDRLPEAGLWGTMKATASWLGVPMLIGDRVVGVISVQSYRPRAYGEEEQLLLSTIADQVAVAVESSRLFQAEQEQRELAESLEGVTTALTATLDFDQVLECILEQVSRVVPNDAANIMLMEGDQVRVVGWRGYERFGAEEFLSTAVFHISEVPSLQQMLESRESVVITDTLAHSDWTRFSTLEWLRSYAAAPIIVRNEVIGFLNVDSGTPGFFTQADAEALRAFAGHAAVAIENARLYEVAQQEIAERKQAGEVLERRAAQLATLNHIGRHVASILDLQELLQNAVDAVQEDLGYLQAAVLLVDEDADDLYVAAATSNFWDIIPDDYRQPVGEGAIGIAAETGESVLVKDASTDSRPYRAGRWFSPSSLSIPINIGGRVIGVLEVEADVTNAFDENDQAVLETMADQVAVAIENARLFEEEKRRATQLALISEVGQKAASILDLEKLMGEVVRSIQESFDYYNVALGLLDEERREIVVRAIAGGFEHIVPGEYRQSVDEGIIGFVARTGEAWLANDTGKDPHYVKGFLGKVLTKSELAIPIRLGGEVIGVLDLQSIDLDDFDPSDVIAMEALADRLAVAIENARLYEAAQQKIAERKRAEEALRRAEAETHRRLEEQIALREAGTIISSSLDLPTVLTRIAEQMCRAVEATSAYISSYDPRTMTARVLAEYVSPQACAEEQVSDLGVVYVEDGEEEWIETMKAGKHDISHIDGPDLAESERAQMQEYGAKTILYVPLRAKEQLIGYAEIWESRQRREFTPDEIALCQGIAQQAAIAFENARLYEAEQQRRRDAEALRETALALTSDLDRNRVVERILAQLQQVVPYDSASVQLLQGDMLVLIGGRGFPNLEDLLGVSFPVSGDNPNREVMRTLSPSILEDAPVLYEAFTEEPFAAMGIRSWLGVPMLIGERTVGMITLDKCQPGFYTQEHARLAQAFAAQAAIAIENARLFEEVEKRRVYLEGVLGGAPDAIVTLSAHTRVVEWNPGAEKLFGYSREETIGQNIDDLVTSADVLEEAVGFTQRVTSGGEVPPTETVRYRKDGSPVHVIVAGSPIMVGDELIGAVAVYTDITARKRLEEQLAHMATHDILTGVPNRRGFFALGRQQLRIANRMNERMLLLFADFDGLKQINDTFGHSEGDRALIEVTNILEGVFRESDIVARIAGDEFVVLAIETAEDSAEAITSRLREGLEARNARGDLCYKLSLSVGMARYDPEHPCSLDELMARADRLMYERKRYEQES